MNEENCIINERAHNMKKKGCFFICLNGNYLGKNVHDYHYNFFFAAYKYIYP